MQLLIDYKHALSQHEEAVKELKEFKAKADAAAAQVEELKKQIEAEFPDGCDTDIAKISYKASQKTIVDDVEKLPDAFIRIVKEADKEAIKAEILKGNQVIGARLETSLNIQIKIK